MTYNFDPDRWYDNHRRQLDHSRQAGEMDEETYARRLEDLEKRYDELLRQLDRPFDLPGR